MADVDMDEVIKWIIRIIFFSILVVGVYFVSKQFTGG